MNTKWIWFIYKAINLDVNQGCHHGLLLHKKDSYTIKILPE